MAYQYLLFETKDRIAHLTINRPDKRNALNWQTMEELSDAFSRVAADEDVGGVILTGAGEKSFVAGADIGELAEKDAVGAKEFALATQRILTQIEGFSKPVVAAVNGYALGGGCELAMACHMRIASERAKFGQPEVNLGIIPGNGGTQRLPRLVGKGRAIELVLTGRMVDAEEALRIGLVNQVVPPEKLIAACEELLGTILQKGPVAVRLALEAIHHGLNMTLEEGVQLEANLFGMCFSTEDMREGTRAFLEKRQPVFKGR